MARPPDKLRDAAIAELLTHLRVGADLALAKIKFHTVKRQTWQRWVKEAEELFKAEGGKVTPPSLPETPKKAPPAKGKEKAGKHPNVVQFPGAKSGDGEQRMTPAEAVKVLTGMADDGNTHIVLTKDGIRERVVVTRWSAPPVYGPKTGLALLENMTKLWLDNEAGIDSLKKKVAGGHIILDDDAYDRRISEGRKLLMDMLKVLTVAKGIDSIRAFCDMVMDAVKQQAPDLEDAVLDALHKATEQFESTKQWPAAIALAPT